MLLFGFLGETNIINRMIGFILGSIMWIYIIYEIFKGQAAQIKKKVKNKSVIFAYDMLKYIITIGWSIYPIGYLLKTKKMNLLYNYGDFINKILFGLVIYYAAKMDINL